MKTNVSESFACVKPLCVKLAKKFSVEDLEKLENKCKQLDETNLKLLQEYLVFPTRLNIYKANDLSGVLKCFHFIKYIFSKSKITSWDLFADILLHAFRFMYDIDSLNATSNIKEEYKLLICELSEIMILNSTDDIRKQMYSSNFCLPLAQYIYTLLEILKREKSKDICASALRGVSTFIYCNDSCTQNDEITIIAGDRGAAFLPGVTIVLRDIICGDEKRGHVVISNALHIFGKFLCLTLGDKYFIDSVKRNAESINDRLKDKIPIVLRDKEWVDSTVSKLEIAIDSIIKVANHDHWKVRLALVNFSGSILNHCSNNMKKCISPLLECLLALLVDNYDKVAKASEYVLSQFIARLNGVNSFLPLLEDNINKISSKLIKMPLYVNDNDKLLLLRSLHGYVQVLGLQINNLLYCPQQSEKLLIAFLNIVQFDYEDFNFLVENLSLPGLNSNVPNLWPKKRFIYFTNDDIMSHISSIFFLLGYYGDSHLLIDFLLEKLSVPQYRHGSLFLLINIIKGLDETQHSKYLLIKSAVHLKVKSKEYKKEIVTSVLDNLLSAENFQVPITYERSSEFTSSDIASYKVLNANVLQICLILECIATCAEILKEEFCPLLMHILCSVMQKVGSANLVVSYSGKLTLQSLAISCGHSSVTQLITQNADYLTNSIIIGLRHFTESPELAVVIRVALDVCETDVLSHFKEPIYYLLEALDNNQRLAATIMPVLFSVAESVTNWHSVAIANQNSSSENRTNNLNKDLVSDILEFHRLKKIEMSYMDEVEEQHNSMKDEVEEHNKSVDYCAEQNNLSLHMKLIAEILERCIHLQSSKDIELCILALKTIRTCMIATKSDIDKMLPYVHRIWDPLISQFSKDAIVVSEAFKTLLFIANECGDFVKARTMKVVWPKLLGFLHSLRNTYHIKHKISNYQNTSIYKLLLLLLSKIGGLAEKLDLTEKEYETAVLHCLPYIEKIKPISIQQAAEKSLTALSNMNPDAFWFYFNEFYGQKKLICAPHHMLYPINFSTSQPDDIKHQSFL